MTALYFDAVELSLLVNAWLKHTGMKKGVVAKRAGIAASKFSPMISGDGDPRWSTVEKIARGFNVTVAAFVAGPPRRKGGSVDADRTPGDPLLAELLEQAASREGTWTSDVSEAISALVRALGRGRHSSATDPATEQAGRTAASDR